MMTLLSSARPSSLKNDKRGGGGGKIGLFFFRADKDDGTA